MKEFLKLTTALLFSALIMCACNENLLSTLPVPEPDSFPNTVGNQWTYERIDSLTLAVDTIHVEITDTTTLPNGELAKIWVSTVNGTIIATDHVSIVTTASGDSVKIYNFADFTTPQMVYALPLEVGASWVNAEANSNNCQYDFTVKGVENVETPSAAYPNTFSVWRADTPNNCPTIPGFINRRRVWLVHGLGIVQNLRLTDDTQTALPISNDVWMLIDFNITPAP